MCAEKFSPDRLARTTENGIWKKIYSARNDKGHISGNRSENPSAPASEKLSQRNDDNEKTAIMKRKHIIVKFSKNVPSLLQNLNKEECYANYSGGDTAHSL